MAGDLKCGVCWDPLDAVAAPPLAECGHAFCADCWTEYVEGKVRGASGRNRGQGEARSLRRLLDSAFGVVRLTHVSHCVPLWHVCATPTGERAL